MKKVLFPSTKDRRYGIALVYKPYRGFVAKALTSKDKGIKPPTVRKGKKNA